MSRDSGHVVLLAAGDIEWSGSVVRSPILCDWSGLDSLDSWLPVPRVRRQNSCLLEPWLRDDSDEHADSSIRLRSPNKMHEARSSPFRKISKTIRSADIMFANLEMPLTSRGRRVGAFRGQPRFAKHLADAGVSVVSLANNHAMDCEGVGLRETIRALRDNGIGIVGAGKNLAHARRPHVIVKNGIRVGFLAYNQLLGKPSGSCFALCDRAGVAPLDPSLVLNDIRSSRRHVELLVLSLHWGQEEAKLVSDRARSLAHAFVDAGADIVVGHHPHIPQGIEAYRKGFVAYSLGNFVFSHGHHYWEDNLILEIVATSSGIVSLKALPITGQGRGVFRPMLLKGARADSFFARLRRRSNGLGTRFEIRNGAAEILSSSPSL